MSDEITPGVIRIHVDRMADLLFDSEAQKPPDDALGGLSPGQGPSLEGNGSPVQARSP